MRMGTRELMQQTAQVQAVLEQYPETRNSDMNLWLVMCEKEHPGITKRPFDEVILRRHDFHLPKYGTVSRVRRKLQEKDPSLRGTDVVTDMKYEQWKDFKEYAKIQ